MHIEQNSTDLQSKQLYQKFKSKLNTTSHFIKWIAIINTHIHAEEGEESEAEAEQRRHREHKS